MDRASLEDLRGEAGDFLAEVQQLPGFKAALDQVGPSPDAASVLPFWSIRRLARGDSLTGKVEWQYFTEEELDEEALRRVKEFEDEGYPVRISEPDGKESFRIPRDVPTPIDEARDKIEAYREAVEGFARDYLLNAQWAPSAVHDAIRSGMSIALPHPPPDEWIAPPIQGSICLDADRPLPRSLLRELGEALLAVSEAKQESRHDRPKTWLGALDAVRAKLDERPLTATQRSNRSRGCRLLNAAVNGAFDVDPVDWAHQSRLAEPDFKLGSERDDAESGK